MLNQIKTISFLLITTSICLGGCGSGGGSGGNGSKDESAKQNSEQIVISSSSILPNGGKVKLRVDNSTTESVYLSSYNLSGSGTLDFNDRSLPQSGNISNASALGCDILKPHEFCYLSFTPTENDGAVVVQLKYITAGASKNYTAAQLLEYSSKVNKYEGFVISNLNLGNVVTTSAYALSIPFILSDDFASLDISASRNVLSKEIYCNGMTKNSSCTAILRLSTENETTGISYENEITMSGVTNTNEIRQVNLISSNTYANGANILINRGSLIMKPNPINGEGMTKTLSVLNNGIKPALKLSESLHTDINWVTVTDPDQLLSKEVMCNGAKLAALPTQLASGEYCDIIFRVKNSDGVGLKNYQINYDSGIFGFSQVERLSRVYVLGPQSSHYLESQIIIN